MIRASVVGTTEASGWGNFDFLHLPSSGDQIEIGNVLGSVDFLRVLYVKHYPVKVPAPANARPDPSITIVAEYLSSYGD